METITITKEEVLQLVADQMKGKLTNEATPMTYESYLEWRKPYAVTDKEGKLIGIALPEINKMVLPHLLNDGKPDTWDNMMKHAEKEGAELLSLEEGRCFQHYLDEIDEILSNFDLDIFSEADWYWSKEQHSASLSWYWLSSYWGNNLKNYCGYGVAVCALPR